MTNIRSTRIRVGGVLSDIDNGNINASEFPERIRELGLAELRELGRELIARAEQDKGASGTKEYIPIVQEAVRILLDIGQRNPK